MGVFVRRVFLCVCAQQTGQSDLFKTVKATDFKFDAHVSRDSPDMTQLLQPTDPKKLAQPIWLICCFSCCFWPHWV